MSARTSWSPASAGEAAAARVRERVTADRVEPYFAEHRAEFGTARVARLDFPDAESVGSDEDWVALAERTPGARLVIEDVPVTEIGQAKPGEVLAPTPRSLVKVISVSDAVLDEETRRRVERRIFDEWLAERRRAAKIEWFWGTTARTGAL